MVTWNEVAGKLGAQAPNVLSWADRLGRATQNYTRTDWATFFLPAWIRAHQAELSIADPEWVLGRFNILWDAFYQVAGRPVPDTDQKKIALSAGLLAMADSMPLDPAVARAVGSALVAHYVGYNWFAPTSSEVQTVGSTIGQFTKDIQAAGVAKENLEEVYFYSRAAWGTVVDTAKIPYGLARGVVSAFPTLSKILPYAAAAGGLFILYQYLAPRSSR